MTGTALARKVRGIDDVLVDLNPGKVEKEKMVTVVSPPQFQELVAAYERILTSFDEQVGRSLTRPTIRRGDYLIFGEDISFELSPAQINSFCAATIVYEDHRNYKSVTGLILTKLMQNSYYAGFNDFALVAPSSVDGLARHMQGSQKNPIQIQYRGHISDAAALASYVHLTVHGSVDWLGSSADNCEFIVHGTARIPKTHQENCTFKTSDYETANKWIQDIRKGNRVIYIQANGQEVEIRR